MATVPDDANPQCPGTGSSEAGKASACAGCPNQQACAAGTTTVDVDLAVILERLSGVRRKLLVLSGKGGVGKSTTTAMLARALAADPACQVGVLDVDICGPSQPRVMGVLGQDISSAATGLSPIYVEENLAVMSTGFLLQSEEDAVMWRGPNKNGLIKRFLRDVDWGELDYLVIDTPPGTSDEHLTTVRYLLQTPSTAAIVVTTPQEVSLLDVRKEITFCQQVKLPLLGIVENMTTFICPKCKHQSVIFPSSSEGGVSKMSSEFGLPVLARLPLDPLVARCCDEGLNYLTEHPGSPVATAYVQLANRVKEFFDSTTSSTAQLK